MALRDKLTQRVQPFLEPGETVQAVFPAQTMSQWWALLTVWALLFKQRYMMVVVTDQRIVVGTGGRLSMTKMTGVARSLPRHTRIGPPQGLWYKCETLGEKLYIHRRFHKDIAQADALIGV